MCTRHCQLLAAAYQTPHAQGGTQIAQQAATTWVNTIKDTHNMTTSTTPHTPRAHKEAAAAVTTLGPAGNATFSRLPALAGWSSAGSSQWQHTLRQNSHVTNSGLG